MKVKGWAWLGKVEPEELELTERELAEPAADEVLVLNKAVALNPVDWKLLRSTTLGWKTGHFPGVNGAGVVVVAGAGAQVKVGARVAYHQALELEGSFATHTVIAAKALLTVPDEVSFASAATLPCPGLTAWQAIEKIPDAAGRDVLVIGGGAATGCYLIQLARKRGYRVWTTAAVKHHAMLKDLGAAGVFDYKDESWREQLQEGLKGAALYAAFDNVNEANARTLAPLLGYNGHLVCITGRLNTPATPAFSTVISLHEVALGMIYQFGSRQDWETLIAAGDGMLRDVASGEMRAPAIQSFAFDCLAAALRDLKAGRQTGKLVAEI